MSKTMSVIILSVFDSTVTIPGAAIRSIADDCARAPLPPDRVFPPSPENPPILRHSARTERNAARHSGVYGEPPDGELATAKNRGSQ
jgi:hypothetical protein